MVYAVMANAPADADNLGRRNTSHGNSMIVDVLGDVLDEATSFEQRLVVAQLDLSKATGSPAQRTLGEEHPAYAEWIRAGLQLVQHLELGCLPLPGILPRCRFIELRTPTRGYRNVDVRVSDFGNHGEQFVSPGAAP